MFEIKTHANRWSACHHKRHKINIMSAENFISPLSPELPVNAGESQYWGRLYGSSKALAICNVALQTSAPLVVITADINSADHLMDEIGFYLSDADKLPILSFSDWETLPYDLFSPYQDLISSRLETLVSLPTIDRGILIVPVSTIMHRLVPLDYLKLNSLLLETGQRLDINSFRKNMVKNGYRLVSQVMEHGDIAIRGSLLDIFPMGHGLPFRIDFLDDEIDSIRTFNLETQRSMEIVTTIRVLPAREISLSKDTINRFRARWRTRFPGNPASSIIYRDVSDGIAPPGIEYYLPLFHEKTSCLLDYVNHISCIAIDDGVINAQNFFWKDIHERYEQRRNDQEHPLLSPQEIFYSPTELDSKLKFFPRIQMEGLTQRNKAGSVNFATKMPLKLPIDVRARQPLGVFLRFLNEFDGRVLIVAESIGRREIILELIRANNLRPVIFDNWLDFLNSDCDFGLTISSLEQGALIDIPKIAIISENQLFGERAQQRRLRKRNKSDSDAIFRNLAELTIGSPIVHEENGIGRYQGLITLEVDDIPNEYICIEYDQGDKLYVPVSSLELISRYTGTDPELAPLHRLGSGHWLKAKKRAQQRIHDVAAELLELHSRRAARTGKSFILDENAYRAFIQRFPFEETPDQIDAINDVIQDLCAARPMDRLICGDAGFGKTEVAMRAAFIVAGNNYQVALLVPTTLLAQQHFQNFMDRFADWPFKIEVLSRFVSQKRQSEIMNELADGKVDIVIGTHKLLQNDICFKQLGLVIIDEEHRFGVRQKERFKSLRAEIDVLTLTATPIPRTLNLALSDLRELSIIASPPSRRLAVNTFVYEWNDNLLHEAILREIKRGGQVYFLHNEVESIEAKAKEIEALVPEARIRIAHGQMPEKQLEHVMLDFYHRRFNTLVCTTIIETGIDVPSANTIIINRANKFGLAQLYQLRGRVGRSHHRAYAYLIIPPKKSITSDAIKRLEAIESLEELGIGFTLATHDLEIRGAGEILGEDQSGQIHEIGFGLYMDLLDRSVQALRSGQQPQLDRPLDHGTEIDIHIPALIPESYLPDVYTRLIMYKRIASAKDSNELESLQEEMIDRFGLLPEPLKNLFTITRLKRCVSPLGVRKIDIGNRGGRIFFRQNTSIDPGKVIQLIQKEPGIYKFDGSDKIRIVKELPDAQSRFTVLRDLFENIAIRNAA